VWTSENLRTALDTLFFCLLYKWMTLIIFSSHFQIIQFTDLVLQDEDRLVDVFLGAINHIMFPD
jgi:hypothetical protein